MVSKRPQRRALPERRAGAPRPRRRSARATGPTARVRRVGRPAARRSKSALPDNRQAPRRARFVPTGYLRDRWRARRRARRRRRSEEHTSELQSLMRISYAVFCLKKKKTRQAFTHYVLVLVLQTQRHKHT